MENKIKDLVKEKLNEDYASTFLEWQHSDKAWLIENAQLIYVAREVYKKLNECDFESMKYILNCENPICTISQHHIENYDAPTNDSIYKSLWDLVNKDVNAKIAKNQSIKVNEDGKQIVTVRDLVEQFPHCNFDLMGEQEFLEFTAEEAKLMLEGFPLVVPKEQYGFMFEHSADFILGQTVREGDDISFKNGTFYFHSESPIDEQTESFGMTFGGGM